MVALGEGGMFLNFDTIFNKPHTENRNVGLK